MPLREENATIWNHEIFKLLNKGTYFKHKKKEFCYMENIILLVNRYDLPSVKNNLAEINLKLFFKCMNLRDLPTASLCKVFIIEIIAEVFSAVNRLSCANLVSS